MCLQAGQTGQDELFYLLNQEVSTCLFLGEEFPYKRAFVCDTLRPLINYISDGVGRVWVHTPRFLLQDNRTQWLFWRVTF